VLRPEPHRSSPLIGEKAAAMLPTDIHTLAMKVIVIIICAVYASVLARLAPRSNPVWISRPLADGCRRWVMRRA